MSPTKAKTAAAPAPPATTGGSSRLSDAQVGEVLKLIRGVEEVDLSGLRLDRVEWEALDRRPMLVDRHCRLELDAVRTADELEHLADLRVGQAAGGARGGRPRGCDRGLRHGVLATRFGVTQTATEVSR